MGTAVIAVLAFAIVLGAAFTALGDLVNLSVTSANSLRNSWSEAERTVDSYIVPTSASVSGTDVDVVISNTGRLKYASPELNDWEVVVRYEDDEGDSRIEYLDYASTLSTGKWTVQQIYRDHSQSLAEVYEPNILNMNEQMVIRGRLANTPGTGTINQVTVAPPEGDVGAVHFDG